MIPLYKILTNLTNNSLFQDWQKQHQKSFLSHFFSPLSKDFLIKQNWEIGFFNPSNKKITIFIQSEDKKEFFIKPEDEVFKYENDEIEALDFKTIKINFEEAASKCKKTISEKYSNEKIGDGFIILQKLKNKTLWNFTFITKSIQFLNVKINAENLQIESHQIVSLVHK